MRSLSRNAALLAAVAALPLGAQSPDDSAGARTPLTAGVEVESRSVGSTRRAIDTTDLERGTRPRTLSELLQARVPGVSVLRYGGDPSHGSRVRVRMPTGRRGQAAPLLVVDGVPVQAPERLGMGAVGSSRFDDFDPEEIERVDVLAGPAGTTLFGSRASNGAILLTTRRGTTGAAQWRVWSTDGRSTERESYPANFRTDGLSTAPSNRCDLEARTLEQCTRLDSMLIWNPLESASPFVDGDSRAAGASVAGGPAGIAAYASFSGRMESGVLIGSEASRTNARVNLERRFFDRVTVRARAGHMLRHATPPANDTVFLALIGSAVDDANRGYRDPGFAFPPVNRRGDRLTRSAQADVTILPWLFAHALVGRDEMTQEDRATQAPFTSIDDVWQATSIGQGSLDARRRYRGVDLRSILSYEESHAREHMRSRTLNGTTGVESSATSWRSLRSLMLQERVGFRDRLFVNVGARRMARARADGGGKWFPALDAAWDAGALGPLSRLRVRGAIASGVPARDTASVFAPGFLTPSDEGERFQESEAGVDVAFGRRAALDLTLFEQSTRDAIIGFVSIPSSGTIAPIQARMANRGVEALGRFTILDRPSARLGTSIAATFTSGNLKGMQSAPILSGGGFSIMPDAPYGVFPERTVTFLDVINPDGLPQREEIIVGAPRAGRSVFPTREIAGRFTFDLPRRGLSAAMTLDHRGGHGAMNLYNRWQCSVRNCQPFQDPFASLESQVKVMAVQHYGVQFIESASYTRLSELAIRWRPSSQRAVLRGLSLGIEARNLRTYTRFDGPDPELQTANTGTSSFATPMHTLPRTLSIFLSYEDR